MNETNLTYEQAVERLLAIPRYKKNTDQVGISRLLQLLGNPQETYKTIHIAGTNGKGSICAYLSCIGIQHNYRMGMFTSPHLVDIRERFQVNGELIAKADFLSCAKKVFAAEEQLIQQGMHPCTFFEMIFALGLVYFREAKVEYAIIEAGMGGRSDSTNVLQPQLSIIASVGLDHTAILGDTIEQIAYEKAGILKPNVTGIVSKCDAPVKEIIRAYGTEVGACCRFTDDYDIRILKNSPEGIDFLVKNRYDKEGLFHTSMCGLYQAENALTAIMAAESLWQLSFSEIADGIAKTRWAARMEEVASHYYIDGAHNHQAMEMFVKTVMEYFEKEDKVLLYAVASDKDNQQMIEELVKVPFQQIIITELDNTRKTDCHAVAKQFVECLADQHAEDVDIMVCSCIKEALEASFACQKDRYVFCVGSLYLAGEVKAYQLQKLQN